MNWVVVAEEHYRSGDSRYDLWYTYAFLHWVAVDADTGRVCRGTREACERWCREQ